MTWQADLHIHSKYSDKPTNWLMKQMGCPESFTEPKDIYKIAKKRGMKSVTITDLNEIKGCLEISKYPDTFISVEISTKFPEDERTIHILAYDISESQFEEIQKVRKNIYELNSYLKKERIFHAVAHSLHSVDDKLTKNHVEKLLLMFKVFELNGCRIFEINNSILELSQKLTPEIINQLEQKHKIKPVDKAWEKFFIAGSDDHTGMMIAQKYTLNEQAKNQKEFLEKVFLKGKAQIEGKDYTPKGMAYNVYSIAYQFYSGKFNIEKYINKDATLKIIDKLLSGKERSDDIISKIVLKVRDQKIKIDIKDKIKTNSIKRILYKTILSKYEHIADDATPENSPGKWFEIANSVTNASVNHMMDYILSTIKQGNFFDIFRTLGSVGSMYFMIAPYFIAYSIAQRDKDFTKQFVKEGKSSKRAKIAHFTDTYYDINGVAKTMQQNLKIAKELGKNLTIITCENTKSSKYKNLQGEVVFDPIGQHQIPEYPELRFNYPPLLEVLQYCYENDFTHFHSATPGTVGLAALAIAKILKKPIYGTYHTAFPQFILNLTGDPTMEEVGWRYMIWYYSQMDIVYVPSEAIKKELIAKGLNKEKIKIYPRGVDIDFFKPQKQKTTLNKTLLYVGRVSKEKNLHLLLSVFKKLSEQYPDLKLKIAGDGPYREEMEEALNGFNAEFVGYTQGQNLVDIYSNADLFVFPSTTDTFGNVVLEAQACGTPVVVTDEGGPVENIISNETGVVVKGGDENALYNAVKKLLDGNKLDKMSRNCRKYMESRSFKKAFLKTWHLYETDV